MTPDRSETHWDKLLLIILSAYGGFVCTLAYVSFG